MRSAGLIAFICAGISGFAYMKSSLTAGQPIQCIAWPFGECETIQASGYQAILGAGPPDLNMPAAIATFVPLTMWLCVVISAHNPHMRMHREGKRKVSPAGWLYLALFAVVLVVSGLALPKG